MPKKFLLLLCLGLLVEQSHSMEWEYSIYNSSLKPSSTSIINSPTTPSPEPPTAYSKALELLLSDNLEWMTPEQSSLVFLESNIVPPSPPNTSQKTNFLADANNTYNTPQLRYTSPSRQLMPEEEALLVAPTNAERLAVFLHCACNTFYGTREQLYEHIKTLHAKNADGLYICPLNGTCFKDSVLIPCKSFKDVRSITDHMLIHTREKPFKCPLADCGRAFGLPGNLSAHFDAHKKIVPFECPFCDLNFRYSFLLVNHSLKKHNQCLSCNTTFDKVNARKHALLKPSCIKLKAHALKTSK